MGKQTYTDVVQTLQIPNDYETKFNEFINKVMKLELEDIQNFVQKLK